MVLDASSPSGNARFGLVRGGTGVERVGNWT